MTRLHFTTEIHAPLEIVFDLARSIDAHIESTSQTDEKVFSGRTTGLIELGETVTWEARHFGVKLRHESKITQMEIPNCFIDEMVSGRFKSFWHRHSFLEKNGVTIMTDELHYRVPFGFLGRFFDRIVLRDYMRQLIKRRNSVLKEMAENKEAAS